METRWPIRTFRRKWTPLCLRSVVRNTTIWEKKYLTLHYSFFFLILMMDQITKELIVVMVWVCHHKYNDFIFYCWVHRQFFFFFFAASGAHPLKIRMKSFNTALKMYCFSVFRCPFSCRGMILQQLLWTGSSICWAPTLRLKAKFNKSFRRCSVTVTCPLPCHRTHSHFHDIIYFLARRPFDSSLLRLICSF